MKEAELSFLRPGTDEIEKTITVTFPERLPMGAIERLKKQCGDIELKESITLTFDQFASLSSVLLNELVTPKEKTDGPIKWEHLDWSKKVEHLLMKHLIPLLFFRGKGGT